jgi:hypothetical protein
MEYIAAAARAEAICVYFTINADGTEINSKRREAKIPVLPEETRPAKAAGMLGKRHGARVRRAPCHSGIAGAAGKG